MGGADEIEITVAIVSDSTGETAAKTVDAARSLFAGLRVITLPHAFVRSSAEADRLVAALPAETRLIAYTIADRALGDRLAGVAAQRGIESVALLDPLVDAFARIDGAVRVPRPGRQHQLDESYHARIAAIDFAIAQDDGQGAERLLAADVILTGVSRTSKTPTCIYLGYQGIRAANVPLVPGAFAPPALLEAHSADVPIVGVTASASRLSQVRRHRLQSLGSADDADYADLGRIQEEVSEARLLFDRLGIPVIDVTRRSIEETAAAIRAVLRDREAAE